MGKILSCSCLLLFLAAELNLSAQENIRMVDTYYPVTTKSYGIDEGLPDRCVQSAYIDSAGRMHLLACPDVQEAQGLGFYQFDGYRAYTGTNTSDADSAGAIVICGETEDELYGFEYHQPNQGEEIFKLITINKSDNSIKRFYLGYDSREELQILNIRYHDDKYYILGSADSMIVIMAIDNGKSSTIETLPGHIGTNLARFTVPFLVTDKDYWFFSSPDTLARVSMRSHVLQKIGMPVPQVFGSILNATLIENHTGDIMFGSPTQRRIWTVDSESNQIEELNDFGESKDIYLFNDFVGNILYVIEKTETTYEGYLLDREGSYHDYSAVLELIHPPRSSSPRNYRLSSMDFTGSLMTIGGDFSMIEVASRNAIQTIPTTRMRTMIEYAPGHLFMSRDRYLRVTGPPKFLTQAPSECLKSNTLRCDIVQSGEYIWLSSGDTIKQYHTASGECQFLPVEISISRFVGAGNDRFILTDGQNRLFSYHISIGRTEQILDEALPGFINQLVYSDNGHLWIATNTGLIFVNIENRSAEYIAELKGVRILTILPRSSGKLWLGTFGAGRVYL